MFFFIPVITVFCVVIGLTYWQKKRNLQGPINEKEENNLPIRSRKTKDFVRLTYVYMAAWVIGKNSRDAKEKIRFVHHYFKEHFGKMDVETSDELTSALKNSTNIRNVAAWVIKNLKTEKERRQLLTFLIDLSFTDGDIIDRETVAIARFADLSGVSIRYVADEIHKRRKNIYDNYQGDENVDLIANGSFFKRRALFRLDLTESATQEEIRKAYRKLASELHPDKFEQATEEEKQKASEKFIEVKEAYQLLKR